MFVFYIHMCMHYKDVYVDDDNDDDIVMVIIMMTLDR